MATIKRLFTDDYLFKGKYVSMVNDLTSEIDPDSGATIFKSAVELFLASAIVGAHYNVTASPVSGGETKRIMASQFTNHFSDLTFAFSLVMLNADKEKLSSVDRINNAFRYSEVDPEYVDLVSTFERYMLGGLTFLHDRFFSSDRVLRFEDYNEIMRELLYEMSGKEMEGATDDGDISFEPAF